MMSVPPPGAKPTTMRTGFEGNCCACTRVAQQRNRQARSGRIDLSYANSRGGAMAEPQMVDPHDVVMTGENSFVRLSNDGGKTMTDRVSHWRVLWSPAGQGHCMFVESPLTGDGPAVYADNAGLVRYLQRRIEALLHKPFADESLPIIDAEFAR